MPFDQKRINGPEVSFTYQQFIASEELNQPCQKFTKRVDGRSLKEHRKFAIQLDVISKAKGSCYMENGATKIICAVFELREIPRINKYADKGQLYCDFKYAPFSRKTRKSVSENEEKLIASNVKTALESVVCLNEFPNYQIDVFILVLEDDGAVMSTAIQAAGMALVDASVACYDLLCSSTAAVRDGHIIIDPSGDEEEVEVSGEENYGTMTVSSLSSIDQISQILFKGFIEPNVVKEMKNDLLEINKSHVDHLKKILSIKISRENRES